MSPVIKVANRCGHSYLVPMTRAIHPDAGDP